MDKIQISRKRERSNSNESIEFDNVQDCEKKLKLPKKSDFRMHAHCNPLAEMSIP